METIQSKRATVLQETVQYYSQDPVGRRCISDGMCHYSPKTVGKEETSEGCAVGRLLSPELREELDKNHRGTGVSVDILFHALPQEVKELGQGFLSSLQSLHDDYEYWNSEGLTEDGEAMVKRIQECYCM